MGDQQEIPNEDALSLVFDDTILFDIDKFSGYDRMETGTRANVGVRYTAQFASGAYARAVFGQSYQIAGDNEFDTDFYRTAGLATDSSDYVSGFYIQAARFHQLLGPVTLRPRHVRHRAHRSRFLGVLWTGAGEGQLCQRDGRACAWHYRR